MTRIYFLYREDAIKEELDELVRELSSLSAWCDDIDINDELRDKVAEILEDADDRYEAIKDIKAAGYGKYLPLFVQ